MKRFENALRKDKGLGPKVAPWSLKGNNGSLMVQMLPRTFSVCQVHSQASHCIPRSQQPCEVGCYNLHVMDEERNWTAVICPMFSKNPGQVFHLLDLLFKGNFWQELGLAVRIIFQFGKNFPVNKVNGIPTFILFAVLTIITFHLLLHFTMI